MSQNIPSQSFEEALKELESIVRQFEEGSLTLDQAVQAYERGMALQNYCRLRLDEAKMTIETLNAQNQTDKEPECPAP